MANYKLANNSTTNRKKHTALAKKYAKETIDLISEGFDIDNTNINAQKLMFFNLVFDSFTTPSKNQYKHGWLWDSGFVSIGWLRVNDHISSDIYQKIYDRKSKLIEQKVDLKKIRNILKEEFKTPLFDEYFLGKDYKKYSKGTPLGSEMMTWTAAVFLDLYYFLQEG